jgi:hypothetical protein
MIMSKLLVKTAVLDVKTVSEVKLTVQFAMKTE